MTVTLPTWVAYAIGIYAIFQLCVQIVQIVLGVWAVKLKYNLKKQERIFNETIDQATRTTRNIN